MEIVGYKGDSKWYSRKGYFYVQNRIRGSTISLRCSSERCPARWTIHKGFKGPVIGDHNHARTPWVPNRNLMFNILKKRASSESTPLNKIYKEEAARFPDAALHLAYDSVVSSMRKWRRYHKLAVSRNNSTNKDHETQYYSIKVIQQCVNCNSIIHKDTEEYYFTRDIGPEIISVIEKHIECEIDTDAILCKKCFDIALSDLENLSSHHTKSKKKSQLPVILKTCVWCKSDIKGRRTHSLPEGPERNEILLRIHPRKIADERLVCYACWVRVRRIIKKREQENLDQIEENTDPLEESAEPIEESADSIEENADPIEECFGQTEERMDPIEESTDHIEESVYQIDETMDQIEESMIPVEVSMDLIEESMDVSTRSASPAEVSDAEIEIKDANVCVWCTSSLYNKRVHALPEGPERNEIASRIVPREIPSDGCVCYACWMRAHRRVGLQPITKEIVNPEPPREQIHEENRCVWCTSTILERQRKHLLRDTLLRNEIATRIHAAMVKIPEKAVLCDDCWIRAQEQIVPTLKTNRSQEIAGFRGETKWFSRDGHFYIQYRSRRSSISVRCASDKCPARWINHKGKDGPIIGEHNHAPMPWVPNRNLMFNNLRRRAASESTELSQIYKEEAARYPDAAPHIAYKSVVDSMRKWRRKQKWLNAKLSARKPVQCQDSMDTEV